jgi:hypothetical protein
VFPVMFVVDREQWHYFLSEYFGFHLSVIIPFFHPSFQADTIDPSVVRSLSTPRITENKRELLLLFGFVENDVTTLCNAIFPFFVGSVNDTFLYVF